MNKRYPHITTPLRVSGNLMKNRIILAPSTIHSANDGTLYPLEDSIAFGAGMEVTVAPSKRTGRLVTG